jgi:deoxyhypusine synthase
MDDHELYKYHIFRIYDVLVPEEDYVKLDYELAEMYREIATERKGESLSSNEFAWEIGKRLKDSSSILRAAYEEEVPVFMPAVMLLRRISGMCCKLMHSRMCRVSVKSAASRLGMEWWLLVGEYRGILCSPLR